MNRLFRKEQILTIPNLLSMLRLLMIPAIIWTYLADYHIPSVVLVALSALTDIVDGIIARKCNMVSDFGKILDPMADKLTQAALIVCLIFRYHWMILLFVLFAIKELTMGIVGLVVLKKKDVVNSAQWFGKLSTVVLYAVMGLLFLFPAIPPLAARIMILVCAGVLTLSLVKYVLFYVGQLKQN